MQQNLRSETTSQKQAEKRAGSNVTKGCRLFVNPNYTWISFVNFLGTANKGIFVNVQRLNVMSRVYRPVPRITWHHYENLHKNCITELAAIQVFLQRRNGTDMVKKGISKQDWSGNIFDSSTLFSFFPP